MYRDTEEPRFLKYTYLVSKFRLEEGDIIKKHKIPIFLFMVTIVFCDTVWKP
jgi:hypothetical protein